MLDNAIVECVPNFSEGRDARIIDAIAGSIAGIKGVKLLDVDPGADTNRTVYTFAGRPAPVVEAALRAARTAQKLINMRNHTGSHPRMGALDVCPFVPVSGISMDECVILAREFGKSLAAELDIPVYLYEKAATKPERRSLADIRAGEYEGLAAKLKDPQWLPDFGPARFDPAWGATVTGARDILLAYNVNLNTEDVKAAKEIALDLRESGHMAKAADGSPVLDEKGHPLRIPGRLKAVRAIGWHVEDLHCAQVSMNILDYRTSPLWMVYEVAAEEAARRGLSLRGSELVGLVPLAALVEAGRYFQRKKQASPGLPDKDLVTIAVSNLGLDCRGSFDVKAKVIEWACSEGNALVDLPLTDFIDEVSSPSPAPGGGTVSACLGALGAALGAMAANISLGKKAFSDRAGELGDYAEASQELKRSLLGKADEDTAAFNAIMKVYKQPKGTEEERIARTKAILEATMEATKVPLATASICLQAMELCLKVLKRGYPGTASDAAVGFLAARAGLEGALLNVRINLKGRDEDDFSAAMRARVQELYSRTESMSLDYSAHINASL